MNRSPRTIREYTEETGNSIRIVGNMTLHGDEEEAPYPGKTMVFAAGGRAESSAYHADLSCPRLVNTSAYENGYLRAYPLESMYSMWGAASPCSRCTLGRERGAHVAVGHDGANPVHMCLRDGVYDRLVDAHPTRVALTDGGERVSEGESASEQFDLTVGMEFETLPVDIHHWANELEDAEAFDDDAVDDEALADYIEALKRVEDAAEEARKEVFEELLDKRVDVGGSIGSLSRRRGSHRFVRDEPAAANAIREAGGDPTEAMSMNVGDLVDVATDVGVDPAGFIGEKEYTYYRRDD